ncbi:MAG: serine/threonine protein kinase [Luteolibacter sp.]
MSQVAKDDDKGESFRSDHRLIEAYLEATKLDEEGLEVLCPSYAELSEISNRYDQKELIGKGGVKEVSRTYDNRTQRWIAMAQLREDRGPEFYDLFVNEAWLTASLNHPNIIDVHDVGIDSSGRPFFTMDLKGNTTLSDLIKGGDRSQRYLLQDFLKICDAVSYAHSKQIIHLDLKPDNVQTDAFGEVLVCDWGMGKSVSQADEYSDVALCSELRDNMTLVGEVKGSPGYMAPEQVEQHEEKDHRTDVFSLGAILYAILTGEPPFTGNTQQVLNATSVGNVADPISKYPSRNIPASLAAVTLKALAKVPDDRYDSVKELRDDVERYLDGYSTNAEDRSFRREARLFVSRNKKPVLIASLSLILITVLSTLFIQQVDFLNQSVMVKSKLARKYASEAEVANDLYVEALDDSKQRQVALSNSLLSSVRNLKSKGVFDTPMKSIREAIVLAEHAKELDPNSKAARYQLFTLHLIQLNFAEALKYPLGANHHRSGYMTIAEAFPEFDYNKTKRPSLGRLCDFLEKIRKLEPNHSPVVERMISYDAALRSSEANYGKVILELVKYLNPDTEGIELENSGGSEFTLRSSEGIRLISDAGGSGECVLRYLKPRSLVLDVQGEFNLRSLNGLMIRELDISTCSSIKLKGDLSLFSIEKIVIDSSKHSAESLRKWIRCRKGFTIVEIDQLAN